MIDKMNKNAAMDKLRGFGLLMVLISGCTNQPTNSPVVGGRDTIVIIQRDTIVVVQKPEDKVIENVQVIKSPVTEIFIEKKVIREEKKSAAIQQVQAGDTTFHYYSNKRVSVKITPWVDGERWVLLYNLLGEETYRSKDIRKSYTEVAQLKFHSNGAVSTMNIHLNPGASQYWYETTITFSTTNDPLQKSSERKPYEDLSTTPKPWEYWDSKTKQWRKQEVME
jgi:hypothetical protein